MRPRRPAAASRPAPRSGLRERAHAVCSWVLFYLALLLLGVLQFVWAGPAFVLRHVVPLRVGHRIGRRLIHQLFRQFFRFTGMLGLLRIEASALDALDPREPMILASNHPSVVDALIFMSRLDNLNCIMKASLLDNVLVGSGARLAGYISNEGVKTMMRMAAADLKRGGQLVIFPEGTRTLAAPVNEFKCGFAAIARLANVPVQTVIIETDTPFLSKGWSILKKPSRLPMTFRVRLGRRFHVGADIPAFVADLRTYFIAELVDAELGDLRRRPVDEAPPPVIDDALGDVQPAWQTSQVHTSHTW